MKSMGLKVIFTLAIFSAGSFVTHAAPISKNLERNLIKVCEAIKNDNPLQLSRALDNTGLKSRSVLSGIMCNGMDATSFAMAHNAKSSAKYIVARIPQRDKALVAKN